MATKGYISVFISLLSVMITSGQSISMVADLNSTRFYPEELQLLFVFRNKLYYTMKDNKTVYAFDGTNPATVPFNIKYRSAVYALPNAIYISTSDSSGSAMWKYDGENPPVKLFDIAFKANGQYAWDLTWFNNKLYYIVTNDPYDVLWEYDEVHPPHIIDSIRLGDYSYNKEKLQIFNNLLYFRGADNHIYSCDGVHPAVVEQNAGQVTGGPLMFYKNKIYYQHLDSIKGKVLAAYDGIHKPEFVMNLNGNNYLKYVRTDYAIYKDKLYFSVSDGWYYKHLFVYDGINSPAEWDEAFAGIAGNIGIFDNKLYLTDDENGAGIWTYDGDSARLIDKGNSGFIWSLIVFRDRLYYGTHASHLGGSFWVNDGVHPREKAWFGGSNGSIPASKVVFKNKMYFAARSDIHGYDLWEYDGTTPVMKAEINTTYPFKIIPATNKLFLVSDNKIWSYDGIHPVIEKDMDSSAYIYSAFQYKELLYFYLRERGYSLMAFDGSVDPVTLARNMSLVGETKITGYHNKIYFVASDSLYGNELRVINEDNSASLVTDFVPGKMGSNPGNLTIFNDKLYFTTSDYINRTCRLWVYDGINPPVKVNFNSGTVMNSIEGLTVFNDKIYCLVNQKQLWSYSETGNWALIKDNLSVTYLNSKYIDVINNRLYFLLRDDQLGLRLWEYDSRRHPIPVNNTKLYGCDDIASLKSRLYFSGYDNEYNIWEYDDFNSPVKLIDNTIIDLYTYYTADLLPYNNKLYFTARSPVFGEELFVYTPTEVPLNIRECGSYDFNGRILTASGTYYDTIPGVAGNDSIIKFTLQIGHPSQSAVSVTACNRMISPSGKFIWTMDGIYTDTIPNFSGCDSIMLIHLAVVHPVFSSIDVSTCYSYSSPSGKYTWNTSGTYADTIPASSGCDSIIFINLHINSNTSGKVSVSACDGYDSPGGEFRWTMNGTYYDTIPNVAGCDSIITIYLQIGHVDTSVYQDRNVLISNDEKAYHQWIDCDEGNAPLEGATFLTYSAPKNGHYAVILSNGGCVDTSAVYEVIGTGVNDPPGRRITLYPNPTSGNFTIDLGKVYPEAHVTITRYDGQVIRKDKILNTQIYSLELDAPPGIYMINISADEREVEFKLLKK